MTKNSVKNKISLFGGVVIAVLLAISYFIKLRVESGFNYISYTSLLGILILHNPFILALYILIVIFLIFYGIKR
ncbi:MAG: hypothetical protein AABX85_01035 [Nanoarchaeota archaeon]